MTAKSPSDPSTLTEGADPRRWGALLVTVAGSFTVQIDTVIVTVAVPSIQRGLDASASGVQWVVSGYPLMVGLALVAGGRLGDVFGRRRMYLIALTAFTLTSALAGAAPTIGVLVAARLLQGLAGGLITPQNMGLIQDLFRGAERGRAFGLLGTAIGLSTAIGPVVGGAIVGGFGDPDGWRWVFLVNLPVGALALVLAARLVPATERPARRVEIDMVGIGLLGLAVLCVLLPVVQSESGGLRGLWWLLLMAIPLVAAFYRWERRQLAADRAPVLDLRLLRDTAGYASGTVLATVYMAAFGGIWLAFALFFQIGLRLSPLGSGLAVTPFAIGYLVSSVATGRLVHRWRQWVIVAGLSTVAVGLAAVALAAQLAPPDRVIGWAAVPLLVAGMGWGAVIAPNTTLTLAAVPAGMTGVAVGFINTGARIGAALGTALLAAAFHTTASGSRWTAGFVAAMLVAVGLVLIALAVAIWDLWARRRDQSGNSVDHLTA